VNLERHRMYNVSVIGCHKCKLHVSVTVTFVKIFKTHCTAVVIMNMFFIGSETNGELCNF
jgi:hypothetical protein